MKVYIIAAFLAATSAASLSYPQPQVYSAGYTKQPLITIVSQSDLRNPDGSSQWSFAGSDGTTRDETQVQKQIGYEQGNTNRGTSYWISPEGQRITLTWAADENGFQPKGEHLPTPPAQPAEIAAVWATARTPVAYPGPARY